MIFPEKRWLFYGFGFLQIVHKYSHSSEAGHNKVGDKGSGGMGNQIVCTPDKIVCKRPATEDFSVFAAYNHYGYQACQNCKNIIPRREDKQISRYKGNGVYAHKPNGNGFVFSFVKIVNQRLNGSDKAGAGTRHIGYAQIAACHKCISQSNKE